MPGMPDPGIAAPSHPVDRDMPDVVKPASQSRSPLFLKLRLYCRLGRVGFHLLEGFVVGFAAGIFFTQYRSYQQPVIRWWHGRLCRALGLNVRVHGTLESGNALWISNHVSWMDIPVLGSLFPVYFLSKAEVAKWPLVGRLAKAAGTLFIQRGSGDSGAVARQLQGHLNAGRNVLFFPEGTTTDGHTVKRFFSKLFAALPEDGVRIQPVVLCYRDDDGLHPYAPFIDDDEFFAHIVDMLKSEPLTVDVLVLPAETVAHRDSKALALHFEQVMRDKLHELHGGSEPPVRR